MKTAAFLLSALILMPLAAWAAPAQPDPSVAQIEAIMGPETSVQRTSPGEYVIDHDDVSAQQLLGNLLPQKENALKAMQDNIRQRQAIASQAASGVSIPGKRAQCQKLAINSIDRTRCYQELEDLRDRQSQSAQEIADRQKDDDLQGDRLQQEIDAIEQFRKQYGNAPAPAK